MNCRVKTEEDGSLLERADYFPGVARETKRHPEEMIKEGGAVGGDRSR